jgi:transposase-like protein
VGRGAVDCTEDGLRSADPADLVKQDEIDGGRRNGVTTAEAQRAKDLEREVKELRRANEILKLASAFFAQAELDRRFKS